MDGINSAHSLPGTSQVQNNVSDTLSESRRVTEVKHRRKTQKTKQGTQLIVKFKYSDQKRPDNFGQKGAKMASKSYWFKQLFLLYLIMTLFILFSLRFRNELENSDLFDVLINLKQNKTYGLGKMHMKDYLSNEEITAAVENWRAPDDDVMYGTFIRGLIQKLEKVNVTGQEPIGHMGLQEQSLKWIESCSKLYDTHLSSINKTDTDTTLICTAAIFTAYKAIRERIFQVQKQCNLPSSCNRNYTQLFSNQLCYCRHGTSIYDQAFQIQKRDCSKLAENCLMKCYEGFKNVRTKEGNNECRCTGKVIIDEKGNQFCQPRYVVYIHRKKIKGYRQMSSEEIHRNWKDIGRFYKKNSGFILYKNNLTDMGCQYCTAQCCRE